MEGNKEYYRLKLFILTLLNKEANIILLFFLSTNIQKIVVIKVIILLSNN